MNPRKIIARDIELVRLTNGRILELDDISEIYCIVDKEQKQPMVTLEFYNEYSQLFEIIEK